jgi:hypothetical protein
VSEARAVPRRIRQLLEAALDEADWPWCRSWSLLIDAALVGEERDA